MMVKPIFSLIIICNAHKFLLSIRHIKAKMLSASAGLCPSDPLNPAEGTAPDPYYRIALAMWPTSTEALDPSAFSTTITMSTHKLDNKTYRNVLNHHWHCAT